MEKHDVPVVDWKYHAQNFGAIIGIIAIGTGLVWLARWAGWIR